VQTGPRIQQSRRGVEVKSAREIATMRQASRIVATVLREIMDLAAPGMTTGDLDAHAEKRIREMGATPSFKGYHGFPASICASINNEVVHGIPSSKRLIKAGDLLKVDTGAYFDGYHGDSCMTICLGDADPRGIAAARPGGPGIADAGSGPDQVPATPCLTSPPRCKTTWKPTATRWWRTTPATVWAATCTRSPRCSTTAPGSCPT
jgi:methionine aminopeptidase